MENLFIPPSSDPGMFSAEARNRLFHMNSPLPAGFGAVSPRESMEGGVHNNMKVFKDSTNSILTGESDGDSPLPPASSRGLFAESDDYDLLNPDPMADSLFLFDGNNGSWAMSNSLDSREIDNKEDIWSTHWLKSEKPANKGAGIRSSIALDKTGIEPPTPRRYVSVPKIHLQFDLKRADKLRAMNESVDDAIMAGNQIPLPRMIKESSPSSSSSLSSLSANIENVYDSPVKVHDDSMKIGSKRFRKSKGWNGKIACDNCRLSKTKCEGGYPCSRCEYHGKTCTRSEGEVIKSQDLGDSWEMKQPVTNTDPAQSYHAFAKQIYDLYNTKMQKGKVENHHRSRTNITRPNLKGHVNDAQVAKDKAEFSSNVPNLQRNTSPQDKTHCYRNHWCIRPYRHPGHCKHAGKKRSRKRSNNLLNRDQSSNLKNRDHIPNHILLPNQVPKTK
mmetsp:Transcript_17450/g.27885  ORF Transcript_17450/g.27885 Transcript_17450/m.27885 type:complete len:445 (+) Transcript_17450:149-1483(+)